MATAIGLIEYARQKNTVFRIAEGTVASAGGAVTSYFALDPRKSTSILVTHHASDAPTVEVTNSLNSNDDLEHADVIWGQTYDGASTPYLVGDSKGLTGVKVISNSPTNGDVDYSIIQYTDKITSR